MTRFGPLSVEFRVEHPLPRPEVELALGYRECRFVVQQQGLQVGVGIIFARLMMFVLRARRCKLKREGATNQNRHVTLA
jgi:hypothetical protein